MGAIRLRGNTWWIDYYFHGRRMREPVGESKTLAKQALAKREFEIAAGKFYPGKKKVVISFAEMARLYWERYARHKRGAKVGSYLVRKLEDAFGEKQLAAIGGFQTWLIISTGSGKR
ncbi:MAG: hypothetical protein ABIG11_09420 [bacterium]